MVVELMTTAGYFNIGDFIPSIAWLDIQGIQRGMKHLHRKFDRLLTKMMEEHTASAHERKGNPDFLDVIMANQENSTGEKLTITNIKALLLVCIVKARLQFCFPIFSFRKQHFYCF
ncbi:hypothetical protein VitviT2T_008821 [Vitis vinifera]|uniref:Flavonoid 3'-monooxygenase n=1 Tax=Vitis vinifera TaxID=29760 RepID=A0ABY9C3L3_VITVI|nr:hypothetical protein VitviT2T_008821 [Vitis vinifera]